MKVFYFQLLVLVPLILGSGCSSEEDSKDLIDEKNGSAHSSGNPLPLEGPDGDMDRDGIPNAQDSRPLHPDHEFVPKVSAVDGRKLEGPDGDMDGDGIPNDKDPNPLKKD